MVEMLSLIKPPIILNESHSKSEPGDVLLFSSVEEALSYVEPIDVENEEYFAFDSEGRLLALFVEESTGRIQLMTDEIEPSHVAELSVLLRRLLSLYGGIRSDWCDRASLRNLVAAAELKFGHSVS